MSTPEQWASWAEWLETERLYFERDPDLQTTGRRVSKAVLIGQALLADVEALKAELRQKNAMLDLATWGWQKDQEECNHLRAAWARVPHIWYTDDGRLVVRQHPLGTDPYIEFHTADRCAYLGGQCAAVDGGGEV